MTEYTVKGFLVVPYVHIINVGTFLGILVVLYELVSYIHILSLISRPVRIRAD
jgi:hypothetical protein